MAEHLSLVVPLARPLPFLSELLAFLNAYVAQSDRNSLAVFAAAPGHALLVYDHDADDRFSAQPSAQPAPDDPNAYPPFRRLDATVVRELAALQAGPNGHDQPTPRLVSALTKALCRPSLSISFPCFSYTSLTPGQTSIASSSPPPPPPPLSPPPRQTPPNSPTHSRLASSSSLSRRTSPPTTFPS
jgi:hypothetical protein